jgi:hypothetical protein
MNDYLLRADIDITNSCRFYELAGYKIRQISTVQQGWQRLHQLFPTHDHPYKALMCFSHSWSNSIQGDKNEAIET